MKKKAKGKKKVKKRKIKISFTKFLKLNGKIVILIIAIYIIIFNKYLTKVGLCVLCKGENLYIKEFIDYYRNLGYNHIFIYDNNDINGERIEDVIQKEIDEGFISIINYRGDRDKPILRVYFDCYEKNNKTYDWLSFFDVDEFLEIKPKKLKFKNFLKTKDMIIVRILNLIGYYIQMMRNYIMKINQFKKDLKLLYMKIM